MPNSSPGCERNHMGQYFDSKFSASSNEKSEILASCAWLSSPSPLLAFFLGIAHCLTSINQLSFSHTSNACCDLSRGCLEGSSAGWGAASRPEGAQNCSEQEPNARYHLLPLRRLETPRRSVERWRNDGETGVCTQLCVLGNSETAARVLAGVALKWTGFF